MNFYLRLLLAVMAWLVIAVLIGNIGLALVGVLAGVVSQYIALLIEAYVSITEHDAQ